MANIVHADAESASADPPSSVQAIVELMKNLKAPELKILQTELQKLALNQPMVLKPMPSYLNNADKFEVWDNGYLNDWIFKDILPPIVHKFTLKWSDGEELNIVYSYQEGKMAAGTTKFKIQSVQVGPLIAECSFPNWDRGDLPRTLTGVCLLHSMLKRHGILTEGQLRDFLFWILSDVLVEHDTKLLEYVLTIHT